MLMSICIGVQQTIRLHLRPVCRIPSLVRSDQISIASIKPVQAMVCSAALPMLAKEGTPNRPANAMPAKVEAGGQQ